MKAVVHKQWRRHNARPDNHGRHQGQNAQGADRLAEAGPVRGQGDGLEVREVIVAVEDSQSHITNLTNEGPSIGARGRQNGSDEGRPLASKGVTLQTNKQMCSHVLGSKADWQMRILSLWMR